MISQKTKKQLLKKFSHSIVLCFGLFFLQCQKSTYQEPQIDNSTEVIFSKPGSANIFSTKEIFEEITYIQLKGTNNKLENSLTKLQVTNENIFVFRDDKEESLNVFDRNGAFKYGISNVEGKHELYRVHDFYVDEKNGFIEMVDLLTKNFLRFDVKTGSLIEQIPTSNPYQYLTKLKNGPYVFRSADECDDPVKGKLHFSYYPKEFTNSFIKKPDNLCEYIPFGIMPFSNQFGDRVLFTEEFSNIIYGVNKNGVQPVYKFDPNGFWVPENLILEIENADDPYDYMDRLRSNYITQIRFIREFNNTIFFTHFSGVGAFWNFYNKNDKSVTTFDLPPHFINKPNDLDGGKMFGIPLANYNDQLVFILQAHHILNYYHQYLSEEEKEKIQSDKNNNFTKLINEIGYNDLPILVFAKLKPKFL